MQCEFYYVDEADPKKELALYSDERDGVESAPSFPIHGELHGRGLAQQYFSIAQGSLGYIDH
jgi:hypothetical protein